jgi:hypothetical protein
MKGHQRPYLHQEEHAHYQRQYLRQVHHAVLGHGQCAIFLERGYDVRQGIRGLGGLCEEVEEEAAAVGLADAVAEPGAVVVEGGHAPLALLAVLRPQRLVLVAHRAVPLLHVQLHLLLLYRFIFLLLRVFLLLLHLRLIFCRCCWWVVMVMRFFFLLEDGVEVELALEGLGEVACLLVFLYLDVQVAPQPLVTP